MSPLRAARSEKFKKLAQRSSPYAADPSIGLCVPLNRWGVRSSAGYATLELITKRGPSRLERRSAVLEPISPE